MAIVNELPVELWRQIFQYATEEMYILDPLYDPPSVVYTTVQQNWGNNASTHRSTSDQSNDPHFNGHPNCATFEVRRTVDNPHATLRTKLAIVSTSSQWRRIGLPYLFGNVVFTSLRKLQLFTGVVRASRYRYVPGPHKLRLLLQGKWNGYGSLIRRVETRISLEPADHSIYADILSDLLKCCPNLRIYVNRNTQPGIPTPSTIIDALARHGITGSTSRLDLSDNLGMSGFCNSIERLEWSGKEGVVVGDLTYLLRSTPNLRKLVLGPVFLCSIRLTDTLSDAPIPLPHLHSLHVDLTSIHRAYIRYTRRWIIPTVKHLQVLIDSPSWQADLLFILDTAGANLRSLALKVHHVTSMLTQDWVNILARCSNLTSLVFNASNMPVLPFTVALPELRVVGLEGCLPDFRAINEYDRPESDRREQLTEHLMSLALRKGTLRTIRMMDAEFIRLSGYSGKGQTMGWEVPKRRKLSQEYKTWKEWSLNLKEIGISLTTGEGQRIA
ncbi:hypothetical protein CPB86DRAFT_791426 [Serendipita vermifera]|nr:hypothetical protein CPB86DRAFT_791426 [Serendipita vermifera]